MSTGQTGSRLIYALVFVLVAGCNNSNGGAPVGTPTNPPATPGAQPTPAAVTAFTVTTTEATITIHSAADCSAIADAWLKAWCRDLVAYRPGDVPTQLQANQRVDAAMVQLIYAGLTWSLLVGDDSICDNSIVAAFLSFQAVARPSPTPYVTPSQHCRAALAATRSTAESQDGRIVVSSQDTLTQVFVALPNGLPLPTLPH
jgi:hypothetical protein